MNMYIKTEGLHFSQTLFHFDSTVEVKKKSQITMMSYSNSISTVVLAAYAVMQCFWWTIEINVRWATITSSRPVLQSQQMSFMKELKLKQPK